MDRRRVHFLQANVNHSSGAQDLLVQSIAEWSVDIAVVCEPYLVPDNTNWIGDLDGSVTVVSGDNNGPTLTPLERGSGYVVAGWSNYVIVGVYFSPNRSLAEFETFLDSVRAAICRQSQGKTLVLGDFNAKARAWGNPTSNSKGEAVQVWAVLSGLSLLNIGSAFTCVRHNGGSVVDLTFATPAVARNVTNWRVEKEVETLSDHRYIRFEVSTQPVVVSRPVNPIRRCPRWALSRLNAEMVKEASIVANWCYQGTMEGTDFNVNESAGRICDIMTAVCDAAMPRARRGPVRRQVYWWTPEIADLRTSCHRARRAYIRCRRRNGFDPALENHLKTVYREKKKSLQLSINLAKRHAREELLSGLNRNPWGRPYLAARKKLRVYGPPVTETLPPAFLQYIVVQLFPEPPEFISPRMTERERGLSIHDREIAVPTISEEEMKMALVRLRSKKTAPGPDGVPGKVLSLALEYLGNNLRVLFDHCLLSGKFPKIWKEGGLCLLRKEGRPPDSSSAYRPIVLLNETGKILEKIVAARLTQHLEEVGPGLSEAQFGFRAGRSTIDALNALKARSLAATAEGDVLLAVSLDVVNAFNSLPFETLREALRYHGVPFYLRRLLNDYLQDRVVLWTDSDGQLGRRRVGCGVPQGSVLGPILWNLGYDWLLRCRLPPGMSVICYADDTLVTARGGNYNEAARLAEVGIHHIVDRIKALGLRVSSLKTEALLFHGPRKGPPRGATLRIQGQDVEIRGQMKYLGLTLDSRWSFASHFAQLVPKLVNTAGALGRLLPNVGGPDATCRQLYVGVLRSMALYGAPVWAEFLTARNRTQLRKAQRVIAVRAIRGYRTVSWTAATLLAGDPPWELQAEVLARVHEFRTAERSRGERPSTEDIVRIRRRADEALIRRWKLDLESPAAGLVTVEAVRPHLERWIQRNFGVLTFRLVQVLTGHGCFGKYLHQIARREVSPACHECNAPVDSAHHTLAECPAWAPQRHVLMDAVGRDLSLSSVVGVMLDSERHWSAMVSFCDSVMALKEAAERVRESSANAGPLRRRRLGNRRRQYAHLQLPFP